MLKYFNNKTKTLTIPYEFNKVLKDIPNDTKIIIFDEDLNNNKYSKFNQEIKKNVFPCSLHTLTFGINFNQEIKENVLPDSLHTLRLGFKFNQEIKENVLPCSIKKICLYAHNNLINNLPLHIEEIYIKFSILEGYNKEVTNLPMTLKKIIVDNKKYLNYITKIPFGCDIVTKN